MFLWEIITGRKAGGFPVTYLPSISFFTRLSTVYMILIVKFVIKLSFLQIKDFWREAQILSNLHHPNVLAFYGVVPDGAGGTLATVTEFMTNGSLRNVLIKKDR